MIQGIVVDTYNSIVDKMKNKYSQQEETSASVIFMGDSTNEKHDIKNSPYWKNLYGRDLEDTEIKGIFQDIVWDDLSKAIRFEEQLPENFSMDDADCICRCVEHVDESVNAEISRLEDNNN